MLFRFKILLINCLLFFAISNSYSTEKKSLNWKIKNPVWTKNFEEKYEEFIATLGKASKSGFCHKTSDCLKSPKANPFYYHLNPNNLVDVFSDCADLPYILRAYFAWMNDLPFAYPTVLTQVEKIELTPEQQNIQNEISDLESAISRAGFFKKRILKVKLGILKRRLGRVHRKGDIRYNQFGNNIISKKYIKDGDNINSVITTVGEYISTASFRTNASNNTTNELFRDTYPVRIAKSAIKAGTVLYDPNGHIAVVYEVTKTGKIHLIDAHPDNSLTNITYGDKFSRTRVDVGGGFSNWRPFSVLNGEINATPNEKLSDYSLEQFQKEKEFTINNVKMTFSEYVRNKLSEGTLILKPLIELNEILEELCNDVKERVIAVNDSLNANLQNQSHPESLPDNIYGTDGDWEKYSSPSRDARLKASIREARNSVLKMINGYKNNEANIFYEGQDLISDLKEIYKNSTNKCVFEIKKSNGENASLNLDQVLENIYKLSFDPYHCSELRWGLLDAESLKSCGQSKDKMNWFEAEQGLRNKIDRDYSVLTDYNLQELKDAPISNTKSEKISIKEILN